MKHRKIEILRGVWGTAALIAPRQVLRLTGGDPWDQRSRAVMRVLGARQAAQSILSGVSPSTSALALGIWVDAVHSMSGIGLAVCRHRYARPALVDAAMAAGWAAAGYRDLVRSYEPTGLARSARLSWRRISTRPDRSRVS